MPNWNENELTIKGKQADIQILLREVKGENGDLDFNKIIPYPEKFRILDVEASKMGNKGFGKDGYNQGGYEWCIANWGTKWNACEIFIAKPEINKQTIYFDTAWSPPTPIIQELSKKYPTLTFTLKFWEGGVGFRGCFKCKNGEVKIDNTYQYSGCKGG